MHPEVVDSGTYMERFINLINSGVNSIYCIVSNLEKNMFESHDSYNFMA